MDMINGIYQCRGDLSMPDCATCLARSVSQLTELCQQTCGGVLQLQGCFVKYDNFSFLGSEDKNVVMKKCGPSNGFDLDEMGRRDAVLGSLMGGNGLYRVGGSEDVQGMAQCVGDLSMAQCQDCLSEAIGRLKKECGGGVYGDMFLGKCYARYTTKGAHLYAKPNHHDSHSESEKTFALIIGLLAGVAILIIFLTFMRRICGRNGIRVNPSTTSRFAPEHENISGSNQSADQPPQCVPHMVIRKINTIFATYPLPSIPIW
ncbi:hypothetical protein KY289_007337 [Solanum tuberosum]|nr:hypothetical protein KY289_007337 [Solanum tuberosum]